MYEIIKKNTVGKKKKKKKKNKNNKTHREEIINL
jgi:hypothetical protein